ncbi:hypothetical protein P5673_014034 [Acropora cervicornis]|uniref:Uncharacterized protein n=1 Tax=Acropora cervicornis TaxID=6130 RepID=A0AAD9V6F5_ACRCE|nr:hypothetical protein P5673_014034 [Acropora cervicornis]
MSLALSCHDTIRHLYEGFSFRFGCHMGTAPATDDINPSKPATPTFNSIRPITLKGNRKSAEFLTTSSKTSGRDINREATELPGADPSSPSFFFAGTKTRMSIELQENNKDGVRDVWEPH